jgi:hypothetical protein
MRLKRKLVKVGFLLLFLFLLAGKLSITAEERLYATQLSPEFSGAFPRETWENNTAVYDYIFSRDLSLRLYVGFNQKDLFLGFYVRDASLNFTDDFTLDFHGSDHLRIYFPNDAETKAPVALYLLPSSKIKEPLFNITGASWRHTSIALHSSPDPTGYFLTFTINRSNLRSTWQQEIPLQIGVHDVNSQGIANTYWLGGTEPQNHTKLVLAK